MSPIPETREAIDELEPLADDDLLEALLDRGRRVRVLVPDCVGLSLAMSEHGVTFTLVASDDEIAVLDAVQYLQDGPCLLTARGDRPRSFDREDFTDEFDWELLARATAAVGVRSTLTLPIFEGPDVRGSVNLYAASRQAFEGLHGQVAEIFAAWAPGAVSNADLSFETRRLAARAPALLRAAAKVATAVGILSAALEQDEDQARRTLRDAAAQAGVTELRLAEALLHLRLTDEEQPD